MKKAAEIVKYTLKMSPIRFIIYFLISLPVIVLPAVGLAIEKRLIDCVSKEYDSGILAGLIFLLAGSFLLTKLTEILLNDYREFVYFQHISLTLQRNLSKKVNELSLEQYESPQTFEVINQAKNCAMFIVFTANMVNMLLQFLVTLILAGGYLTALHPALFLFAFLTAAPVVLEKLWEGKKQLLFMKENVSFSRYTDYYKNLVRDKNRCREIKMLGTGSFFESLYHEKNSLVHREKEKLCNAVFRFSFVLNLLKGICRALAFILLVWLLMEGKISLGDFTVSLSSFALITANLTSLLQFSANIMETSLLSAPYFALLNMEKSDLDASGEKIDKNIRLENVNYTYPFTENKVLEDICFHIDEGQMTALVGRNGAGKSTLLKLVSGMLPGDGKIFYGDRERKEISGEDLLNGMSAVCQNFGRYKMTLADNVVISDSRYKDEKRIAQSLRWADVDMDMHTELGKEFGGTDLSGGQWQRVALARGYYRDRPFIIMDEPTSAIDPVEEDNIYKKLSELAKERTVLLVTHRLGIVRNAHKILVLDDGKLVEQGTFQELTDKKGLFYYIWSEQAKWYNRK